MLAMLLRGVALLAAEVAEEVMAAMEAAVAEEATAAREAAVVVKAAVENMAAREVAIVVVEAVGKATVFVGLRLAVLWVALVLVVLIEKVVWVMT